MREKASITGGKRVEAFGGFLKCVFISCEMLFVRDENSCFIANGSAPAPRSSFVILPSPDGFLKRLEFVRFGFVLFWFLGCYWLGCG